jgi:hypothetical protein
VLAGSNRYTDEVDAVLARELVSACTKLLGTANDSMPEHHRRAIQAAVRYFVIEEDADSDLASVLGLDDDAEVVNAVLQYLGHTKWSVKVP